MRPIQLFPWSRIYFLHSNNGRDDGKMSFPLTYQGQQEQPGGIGRMMMTERGGFMFVYRFNSIEFEGR